MAARASSSRPDGWTIEGAEDLLMSLAGVLSVRVVAKPGGEVEEIHLLTTERVTPKQTVRNVESALLAHFNLTVDHRKISVAQRQGQRNEEPLLAEPLLAAPSPAEAAPPSAEAPLLEAPADEPTRQSGVRILFVGFQLESQRARQLRFNVEVEWNGGRFRGSASGADLPRSRLDTAANACLRAIEAVAHTAEGSETNVTLALEGIRTVEAFDRRYVLVAVHAIRGRQLTQLSGSASIEDSSDRAAILATLQATDRWIRGRI